MNEKVLEPIYLIYVLRPLPHKIHLLTASTKYMVEVKNI